MPEVPKTFDPFNTRVAGKDQDRAPQSPLPRFQARESVFMPNLAQLNPTFVMMAAANMHEQGRLFEPTEEPK